jgi:AAA+ ATPase superfamily predicted ATPase
MSREAADQPLYGRRTRRMTIAPFPARDVAAFVPAYSPVDVLTTYGLIGGLPGHLSLMDPGWDLADNAAALLLDSGGRLVDEAEHMLDAFLDDAAVHYSILEAVATGDQTWNGITRRIKRRGGSTLRPLEWLLEMQLLERVAPITERDQRKAKRVYYRVSDPYIGFWHRFVAPLVTSGAIGLVPPDRLWSTGVAPHVADYMGPVFETVCRQAVRAGHVPLPFEPIRVGEWWNATSSEQVDVAAWDGAGELFVAECKWGSVTAADLEALERRAQILAAELGSVRRTHLAVFSAQGRLASAVQRAVGAGRLHSYTALDLV